MAQALTAFRHQDDRTARCCGILGIIQGLLSLKEVQILGPAAGAGHHDLRRLHIAAIHAVYNGCTRPVSLHEVAGHGPYDLLLAVLHHIEDEIQSGNPCRILHVLPHRAVQISGGGAGIPHQLMILHHGAFRADPGQESLGTAAVARIVVILNVARSDDEI